MTAAAHEMGEALLCPLATSRFFSAVINPYHFPDAIVYDHSRPF